MHRKSKEQKQTASIDQSMQKQTNKQTIATAVEATATTI